MRDMAALRLQAEVSQLENSLKNEEFSLPPYLVADASVLCANLNFIQKFVQSQRFIIVIPLVGQFYRDYSNSTKYMLVSLRWSDRSSGWTEKGATWSSWCYSMARASVSARKPVGRTAWHQLIFENVPAFRFIRTQAVHERASSSINANKRKNNKNKDFFRFQEIVDCCLYFTQQSGLEKPATTASQPMSTVNLLMARPLTTKEQQVIDKDGKIVWRALITRCRRFPSSFSQVWSCSILTIFIGAGDN